MATSPVLLDTDTLSEVIKGRDSSVQQRASQYLAANGPFRFSVLTRYEILRGLKAKQAVRQIAVFEERCRASQVLPVTDEIVTLASDIYALLHRLGQLIGDVDILISATEIDTAIQMPISRYRTAQPKQRLRRARLLLDTPSS